MFRKILVPLDTHSLDERPAQLAFGMARESGGEVVLLHVVDDSFPNPDILSFQLPWADYYAHLRDQALVELEKLRQQTGTGVAGEACVVHGRPADRIVKFAEQEQCDLIVMATNATRGLQHALLGSVTDKVIRLASCPVLVVRLQEA